MPTWLQELAHLSGEANVNMSGASACCLCSQIVYSDRESWWWVIEKLRVWQDQNFFWGPTKKNTPHQHDNKLGSACSCKNLGRWSQMLAWGWGERVASWWGEWGKRRQPEKKKKKQCFFLTRKNRKWDFIFFCWKLKKRRAHKPEQNMPKTNSTSKSYCTGSQFLVIS